MTLSGEVTGHLSIGCSTAAGKYVLPRLLAGYRKDHSHVKATVKVGSRTQVLEWLLAAEVDLAVTSNRVQRSGLHYRRFFDDEIVLIAPTGHPWLGLPYLEPYGLYEERFILREAGAGTHLALQEGLDQVGVDLDRLETVLVLDNSEAIVLAVEEGMGVAFVSRISAERYGDGSRVHIVPVRGLEMRRYLYLVTSSNSPQSPAASAFLEFVDHQLPIALSSAPHDTLSRFTPARLPLSDCEENGRIAPPRTHRIDNGGSVCD